MTVGVARQWNTWDAKDPLAFVHLPSGLTLRFSAFSSADGRYRGLGQGPGVLLLDHESDGRFVRAHIAHAGAELELTYTKPDPLRVLAHLRVLRLGEWGLRFWIACELGFQDLGGGPPPWRPDEPWVAAENVEPMPPARPPRLLAHHRSRFASVQSAKPAVYGGAYRDIATFADDLNARGYFAPPRAEAEARWGVLRFNAQMHPEVVVAVALASDRTAAEEGAGEALRAAPLPTHSDEDPAARAAVRDIVAWNTLWDPANHRPTTALTRNWLTAKFSGWGVWLNDMLFHALLAGLVGDFATARANLEAALEYQSAEGNLACLRTAGEEWMDRSQSPIGAYVLWRLFEMTGDRSLLAEHFPVLLRAHRWWIERRDGNGDGLVEYGSSPTGTGAFVHTKQAAMDKSFMDNAPVFDRASFDPDAHTLTMAEPGLNCLVSLDAQCLVRAAEALGQRKEAASLREVGRRAERANFGALVGFEASGFRRPPLVRRFRAFGSGDLFLCAACGRCERRAGRCFDRSMAARPVQVLGRARSAFVDARRPGERRQRLLARPHLAAASVPRLGRPAPVPPDGSSGSSGRARLGNVRAGMAERTCVPRELPSSGCSGRRQPGRRPIL